jgi:hypothetical protein
MATLSSFLSRPMRWLFLAEAPGSDTTLRITAVFVVFRGVRRAKPEQKITNKKGAIPCAF